MATAWFNAFNAFMIPTHSKQVAHSNTRQGFGFAFWFAFNVGSRVALSTAFLLAAVLFVRGNLASAQEMDSSTLQKEAATEQKPAPDTNSRQQPTAQSQTSPAQAQPQIVQPQPAQPQNSLSQTVQPSNPSLMLPPGTKLPLGLLRPLRLKTGRDIYLQITFPVTIGNEMVIPPGTYIQGVVEKVIRKDRRHDALEFSIRSASMIFLNGYTVPITGTVRVATANAASLSPGPGINRGQPVPAMAAVGGATTPALPPLPDIGKTARTAMIAIGVVGAVAITAGLVIAANRDPEIEAGTPLEIVLPAPVFLDAGRVMAAVQQFNQQAGNAPVQIVQPPVKPKMCYDPGSPGTPDTVIPGSPGTPDTVIPGVNGMPDTVIPGSPRTPDTVISGTPGTPSSTYPCPK